ncbi:hypothetical protein MRX96_016779 [Rhipicephalus microplus]
MGRTVFSKLKTLWRKQSQSVQAAEHEESMFIDEYCKAMYAVAKALDILQREQYMYMGVLQPTLQSLLRYQRSLPPLKYCTPLASSLQDAVKKKRFSAVFEDADLALAPAVHPKFKLPCMTEARKAATL